MITVILLLLAIWLYFRIAKKVEHEDGNTYWTLQNKADTWGIVFRKRRVK